MARSDEARRNGIPRYLALPTRRNLRFDSPDPEIGGVNSFQHRRRRRSQLNSRVLSLSRNLGRVACRGGNSTRTRCKARIRQARFGNSPTGAEGWNAACRAAPLVRERLVETASQVGRLRYCVPDNTSQIGRSKRLFCDVASETYYLGRFIWDAFAHRRSLKRSVARTSAALMPGSHAECPASGTTTYSASGQARCRSSALMMGHTAS